MLSSRIRACGAVSGVAFASGAALVLFLAIAQVCNVQQLLHAELAKPHSSWLSEQCASISLTGRLGVSGEYARVSRSPRRQCHANLGSLRGAARGGINAPHTVFSGGR